MQTFSVNRRVTNSDIEGMTPPTREIVKQHIGQLILDRLDKEKQIKKSRKSSEGKLLDLSDQEEVCRFSVASERYTQYDLQRNSRTVHIIEDTSGAGDLYKKVAGISIYDPLLAYLEDGFDNLDDFEEWKYYFEQFTTDVREYVMDEEGVDIVRVVLCAAQGFKSSVKELKRLVQEYSLEDFLMCLLSSPLTLEELSKIA